MTTHRWLDRPDQLPELAAALAVTPWLAIDTEANSMFVYRECMCLLQLNLGGEIWIVDTLALLRGMGHTVVEAPANQGAAELILHRAAEGLLEGGVDRRPPDGAAIGR